MDINEIKKILIEELKFNELIVNGNGSHFQIIAIGEMFNGMTRIKRQQVIYGPLIEYITDNRIHSLSIKAYTPAEWRKNSNLDAF